VTYRITLFSLKSLQAPEAEVVLFARW